MAPSPRRWLTQAPEVAAKAQAHADRMAAWPKKKVPDLPATYL